MKTWTLCLFAFLTVASSAMAQDIIPWPHRRDLQPVNLVSQQMDVKIQDQLAHVLINGTFHNPNQVIVEGLYLMKLPSGAQVDDLTMTVNGKKYEAELLDSKKARDIYNRIVQARRDPALLELVGGQLIRLRVFPIQPRSDVRVSIRYTQLLKKDGNLVEFQAPFAHNVTNGKPVRQAVLNISLESRSPIKTIYSPTHNIDIVKKDDHHARASYEMRNYKSRKDFLFYYSLNEKDVSLDLLSYRVPGEEGYFVLMVSPRVEVDPARILPKDVIFVYDRSGSMSGEKMQQGKEAILYCLNNLNPSDRFTIVDFATDARAFENKLVPVTKDQIFRADKYVGKMRAAGATNLDEALQMALGLVGNDPKRVPMIFFLTDGLPTVGEQNMNRILANVAKTKEAAAKRCRIFVFGVGLDVNTLFLDKLAEANHGTREYVQPGENLEGKVSGLYQKISNPILTDLKLDMGSPQPFDIYPKILPDLFQGSQLILFGRYTNAGSRVITLRGMAAGEEKLFRYEVNFPEKESSHDYIPRLWAGRKVAFLVDAARLSGKPDKEVINEIIRLGKKYGIVTPYTSFLITEDNQHAFGPRTERRLREGHKSAQKSGVGDKTDSKKSQDESEKLGRAKNAPSEDSIEKDAEELLDRARKSGKGSAIEAIRYVGAKVFYLKKSLWIDGAYDKLKMKDKIIKVKFLSTEYLALLAEDEKNAKYLAVGKRVLIVFAGKVIQVEI